jgi:hypothetical protein
MWNKNLELTDKQEIERLKKIIDEKNTAINGFKKYDAERKAYYERFEENYRLMEERFTEFNRVLSECEDIDPTTKRYFEKVINRIYHKRVNDDIEGGALNGVLTRLSKLDQHLITLVSLSSLINDKVVRDEIIGEIRKAQTYRANIVSYVKRKIGKIEDYADKAREQSPLPEELEED